MVGKKVMKEGSRMQHNGEKRIEHRGRLNNNDARN